MRMDIEDTVNEIINIGFTKRDDVLKTVYSDGESVFIECEYDDLDYLDTYRSTFKFGNIKKRTMENQKKEKTKPVRFNVMRHYYLEEFKGWD